MSDRKRHSRRRHSRDSPNSGSTQPEYSPHQLAQYPQASGPGYPYQSYSYQYSVPQSEDPHGPNPRDVPEAKPRRSRHTQGPISDGPPPPLPQPQFTNLDVPHTVPPYIMELSAYPSEGTLAKAFKKWQETERKQLEWEVFKMHGLPKRLIQRIEHCENRHWSLEPKVLRPTQYNPCFSAVQFECIFDLYKIFLEKYPESTVLSFLLASILSEGPRAYFTDFLLYFSSIGEDHQTRLWSKSPEFFKINLLQPPNSPKLMRDEYIRERGTDEMRRIRVWMSLWKNYDYAFHVLKEICLKETYTSLDKELKGNIDLDRRYIDLTATFYHLIQHSEPVSVFGPVPIGTVLKYAGADAYMLIGQGLQRRYYDVNNKKKKLGLTIKDYTCTCSSTDMLLPWNGSEDP
ncbi:hypothetical protein FQN55_003351 [Onygenales sp. PD_40]|nr:hypothetical protein FQN55_003351 [Onygenales sp. PD_40]